MSNVLIRTGVRSRFALTSRGKADKQTRAVLHKYRTLVDNVDVASASVSITVPPMTGIDEDMRNWSLLMILEHNVKVNRSITSIIEHLLAGKEPTGLGAINPKADVMPSSSPGFEQVLQFYSSIEDHLTSISRFDILRGTLTKHHPLFGPFDAHKWNCMFGFHLALHYKQAEYVAHIIQAQQGAAANP